MRIAVAHVLSLFGLICNAICLFSYIYTFSNTKLSLFDIKYGKGISPEATLTNIAWFQSVSLLLAGFICCGLGIYEFFLFINPTKFKWYELGFWRCILYFYLSATVLGTSGDLGILVSIFSLLICIITLLIITGLFFECIQLTSNDKPSIEQPMVDSEKL